MIPYRLQTQHPNPSDDTQPGVFADFEIGERDAECIIRSCRALGRVERRLTLGPDPREFARAFSSIHFRRVQRGTGSVWFFRCEADARHLDVMASLQASLCEPHHQFEVM